MAKKPSEKDSLKSLLASTISQEEKFEKLKNIISNTPEDYEMEDLITLYQEGIILAEKTEHYAELGSWSVQLFNIYREESNKINLNFKLILNASKYIDKIEESRIRGNIYLKLAAAYYDQNDFTEAIESYTKAKEAFSDKDSIFIADALFFRGQAKEYTGELLSSMADYQLARSYYENLNDQDYVNFVNNGMAVLFSKYGIYEEAEKIRMNLAKHYLDQGDFYNWSVTLYNQSRDNVKQNKNEESLNILNRVYQKIGNDSTADPEIRAMVCLALSNHFSENLDFENQNKLFNQANSIINEQLKGSAFVALPLLKSKILIAESKGSLNAAKLLIEEYKAEAIEASSMDQIIDAYLIQARVLEKTGKYRAAFEALENYKTFKDSLFQANQANSFVYYQTLYETEKKEREILNKNREIKKITASTNTKIITVIVVGTIIVVFLIVWFLLKNLKSARKAKSLQEKFSRDLLLSQENERRRISKDLHDGLGQSLLLIQNKVAMDKDKSASSLLSQAIEELRDISRSLHPFQLEKLGLTDAIHSMLNQIDEETDIFISSELDDVDDLFEIDQQLHIYRIIQETFNNILKHAKATSVTVKMIRKESMVSISIEDNGVGFDFSKKFHDFKSLGLKTLKERTASLGGIMKVDSEKEKGTNFTFLFYQ